MVAGVVGEAVQSRAEQVFRQESAQIQHQLFGGMIVQESPHENVMNRLTVAIPASVFFLSSTTK